MGRVQTPTLAMLVERELAVRAFVPEEYLEVRGDVLAAGRGGGSEQYLGHVVPERQAGGKERLQKSCGCRPMAKRPRRIAARARTGEAPIESIESGDAAHGAAAAVRPDRIAAAREPAVRVSARRRRWMWRRRCTSGTS